MRRKWIGMISAVVLGAAALSAQVMASETTGKEIVVGWDSEPETLDPARAVSNSGFKTARLTGEALLRNINDEATPGAAESYDVNEDSTEYVFHLRENNIYADGTPITAYDFKYSIERLLNPEKANEGAKTGYVIKNGEKYATGQCDASELGIEVIDDYTLKLVMEYPTYPLAFCNWVFQPINEALAEEKGIAYGSDAENLLTNGPFTVTSWVHDSEIVLEKNPNYWNADAISLSGITLKLNANSDAGVDMMLAGELDMVTVTDKMKAETLTSSGFEVELVCPGWQNIHANHKGKTEDTGLFLNNTNFRKALSYGLSRDALVASVLTSDQAASRYILPTETGVEGLFQDEFEYEGWPTAGDTELAQEYLAKALEELGKTSEEIPVFTIICSDSSEDMMIVNAIMDMWNKNLGIECTIDAQPGQSMIQKVFAGEFDFWKGGTSSVSFDSLQSMGYFVSGLPVYQCSDEVYDGLYYDVVNAPTWETRKETLFELEKYFCDNVVDIVLTWRGDYYIYDAKITGTCADAYSLDLTFADVQE